MTDQSGCAANTFLVLTYLTTRLGITHGHHENDKGQGSRWVICSFAVFCDQPLDSPSWQNRQRCQGQSGEKGSASGRSLAFITQAPILGDVPPTKDAEAASQPKVPTEIDSTCAQDGRVPDYCLVRVVGDSFERAC